MVGDGELSAKSGDRSPPPPPFSMRRSNANDVGGTKRPLLLGTGVDVGLLDPYIPIVDARRLNEPVGVTRPLFDPLLSELTGIKLVASISRTSTSRNLLGINTDSFILVTDSTNVPFGCLQSNSLNNAFFFFFFLRSSSLKE
ncbi:hypothetical protein BLOT_014970 [Blomia tropicalis]|nr:hypothetical protein BLOT_014970 [Blomia tropicalis]